MQGIAISVNADATTGGTSSPSPDDATGVSGGGASSEPTTFGDAFDLAVTEVEDLVSGLVAAIPRVVIALLVLAAFWLLAKGLKRAIRPRLVSLRNESIGRVVSSLVSGFVLVLGGFVFATIVFPSVDIATVLGAGGVVALAAGFAFQDILQNLMAGLLLLLRQPFEEGDVVEVDGAIGVVEAITIRETRIRRFDQQEMIVPNSQVYSSAIRIQTYREGIRSSLLVGVGYGDDLDRAEQLAIEALTSVRGVLDDPAPEAFYTAFDESSITLDLRYFHGSGQHELRRVQGDVVKAVKRAFDAEGIDIPFPIRTLDATDDVAAAMRAVAGRATGGNGDARPDARPDA